MIYLVSCRNWITKRVRLAMSVMLTEFLLSICFGPMHYTELKFWLFAFQNFHKI